MRHSVRHVARQIRVTAIVGTTLLLCPPAAAQSALTQFSVTGGAATDARGLRSNAVTASPAVVLWPLAPVSVALSASGSRFAGNDWQAGADASISARTAERWHGAFTLNAAGSLARTSYRTTFSVGEATPALEVRFGPLTAFGGARIATGRTVVRGAPAIPSPQAPVVLTSVTRTSRGPVFGAQWQVRSGEAPLLLAVREERARVAGTQVVDRTASASFAFGRLLLGASAGRRASSAETMTFSSGSASLSLTPVLSLQGSAGRYPSSFLTGASSGRYVSVGLVLRSGGPRPMRLPRPTGVPGVRDNATRLSIRAPEATRVELAGDWNDWKPGPARRAANGVWYADVALAPGEYRYAFRVDGGAWRVPEGAVISDDGFGGKSAYVTVARGSARHTTQHQEDR
jgi:hypothetical protein